MAEVLTPIRCSGCRKVIGEIDYIKDGRVVLKCKCGTRNEIKATPAPKYIQNTPYQNRMNLVKKD